MTPDPTRLAIGCMTGSSIDALDAALVRIDGAGHDMTVSLLGARSESLGPLARHLRLLAQGHPLRAADAARLALRLGELHADAVESLLRDHPVERLDLVAVHGQTVFHDPPLSWQLINPAPILHRHGAPVVYDMRQADLAAGGQGAPITPIADLILFRGLPAPWCIANLGGFCNTTTMLARSPSIEALTGADIGACNQLLDAITRERLGLPFDDGGRLALSGWINEPAFDDLLDLLQRQAIDPRSLGTGDELTDWIRDHKPLSPEDMAATACAAIGKHTARCARDAATLVLAGGGTRNRALVDAVTGAFGGRTAVSDELGVPAQHREAMAMAVLGALCQDRVPITIPRITGGADPAPVSGAWLLP